MFKIEGDTLYHNGKALGPKTALFIDSGELKGVQSKGIKRLHMPRRIDMVFCSGDKVIGVEAKLPDDLLNSWSGRRLARQMRALIDEVDVACLLIRGLPRYYGFDASTQPLWDDLVRLQTLGVVLLPGSENNDEVVAQLASYSEFLSGGRSALAAIAGTDKKPTHQRFPGWFLTMLKGLGPVKATQLHRKFGSTKNALNANEESWKEVKVSVPVIKRWKEAMK